MRLSPVRSRPACGCEWSFPRPLVECSGCRLKHQRKRGLTGVGVACKASQGSANQASPTSCRALQQDRSPSRFLRPFTGCGRPCRRRPGKPSARLVSRLSLPPPRPSGVWESKRWCRKRSCCFCGRRRWLSQAEAVKSLYASASDAQRELLTQLGIAEPAEQPPDLAALASTHQQFA